MKKSKVLLLTLLFAFVGSFSVMATNINNNPIDISEEISNYIEEIDLSDMEFDQERVNIQFMVNSKKEIIVLDVDNDDFAFLIKDKLNYKPLKSSIIEQNKVFVLPLVLQKKD